MSYLKMKLRFGLGARQSNLTPLPLQSY